MLNYNFLKKLSGGEILIGTIITLPSPEIAEILSFAGFDWLFIDTEHTTLEVPDVQRILQCIQGRCPCIVRVPSGDELWIKKFLDIGADGIIVPLVNSAEEAQKIIRFCKYPPDGSRSVGISRAHGYGMKFREYVDFANDSIAVIIQIEHVDAVRNIHSIVQVPGIDGIFVGPYDLSGSMGKVGKVDDQEVQQNIEIVKTACMNAGVPVGIFGFDVECVKSHIDKGYTLIAVGMDTVFLGKTAQETVKALQG